MRTRSKAKAAPATAKGKTRVPPATDATAAKSSAAVRTLAKTKAAVSGLSVTDREASAGGLAHRTEPERQNEELRWAIAERDALHARYFDFYDLAPVGYVTVSAEGLIQQANLTTATLLGVPRAALLKQPFVRFVFKDDQPNCPFLRDLLSGIRPADSAPAPQSCELRLVKSDGTTFWAHLAAVAAQDTAGAPVLRLVLSDISARKQTEAILHQSHERFRNFLRDVPGVAVQGYGMDGVATYWNRASEQLYGYTAQEAIGRNLLDLIIPPEMRETVGQAVRRMAETGQPTPAAELCLRRKDGSPVAVFSSHSLVLIPGRDAELFCLDIDLTARKQAEAALRESQALYYSFIEQLPNAVFRKDRAGRYVLVNSQFCRIKKLKPEDFIGRTPLEIAASATAKPEEQSHATKYAKSGYDIHEQILQTGKSVESVEEYPSGNGSKQSMNVVRMPVADSSGQIIGTQGIMFDITARKEAEAALRASEERYQRITEAVTDYIYTVSVVDGQVRGTTHGPGCLAVTGYQAEDFARDPYLWFRMVAAEDRPAVEEQGRRILAGEDPPPLEHRLIHQNGTVRWVRNTIVPHRETHGTLVAYDGLIQNITERKQAEDALQKSEARHRSVLNASPDDITITDLTGRILMISPAAVTMFRYEREENGLGRMLTDFIVPEDRALAISRIALKRQGLPSGPSEYRAVRRDGSIFHIEVNSEIIRAAGGQPTGMVFIVRDITERKLAEAALRESEASLRESQLIAGLGSYCLDMPTGVWRSSDVLDSVFGIDPAYEHTVESWEAMIHPDDRVMMADYFRNHVLGQRQSFNKQYRIVRHDNKAERWVHGIGRLEIDAAGNVLKMRGTIQDITKRKLAEQAIAALALRNQTLLQTASDGIHVLDEQGQVIEANTAFCRMLGYSREELLQLNVADWEKESSRTELLVRVGELIAQPAVFETRCRRKDGSIIEVEINGVGVTLEDRKYLYASARDITGRKEAEKEKEKLAVQTQQLQKAESLGRMAGAIAHLFNNQLHAVMLRLEMAIDDLPQHAESVASLTEAMKAARKAAEVSTQMLTYLGQSFDKTEPADLSEVCGRGLSLLNAVMPRNVVVETVLPSPGPSIKANMNQIQQVLTNLVTNAWEACGDGGGRIRLTIKTVATADIHATNHFPVDWQPQDKAYACLEVADPGCGIAAQDIETLFDPFFSSKFTGRGLGLPVVLGIARSHNGAVTVESEPGRGSVFRVFLPLSADGSPKH